MRVTLRAIALQSTILGTALAFPMQALAQTSPIETITVTGNRTHSAVLEVAPTVTPLDAVQPTSVISQSFLTHNIPPTANYDEAIKFSPSVFDTAPNGPGLAESQNISIRGFQDGQFNVTFDGIPWGDSNDFTHHSTSYFVGQNIGQISVDRGPGTAATIGNSTFGGTVSILSKAPSNVFGITPYVTYGSFNTFVYGAQVDSGAIASTGGTRVLFDAQGSQSDGYLTNEAQQRQNVFFKVVQPLDSHTTLAVMATVNHIDQHIGIGATTAQIAAYGPNYGLTSDPTSQTYYGYNFDHITTDFEYVDLNSHFGDGWHLDMKVYDYAYYHRGFNGEDPNGEFPNGTIVNGVTYPNNVPGQALTMDYRSLGTIFRLTKDFAFGDIKTGLWYDHQFNNRSLYEIDMTMGPWAGGINTNPDTGASYGAAGTSYGIDRLLTQNIQTLQPYVQIDWKPMPGLTLSPGVRYSYLDRSVNAPVNVKTSLAQSYNNSFDSVLPSITANYMINPHWSSYAQIAKGYLAPNENFFNHVDPASTNYTPEQTWNYQAGTSLHLAHLVTSADVYYIDFSNFITSRKVGGLTEYFNNGGVVYKGVEAEATYLLGAGFSVYANGSLNSAKDQQTHLWIQNAPETTGALGVMYNHAGWYGALLGKWIGARYGDSGQTQGLSPLFTVDASVSYAFADTGTQLDGTSINVQVQNLTDVTKIMNLAGYTVQDGTPLYWTQPGRSVFVNISKRF